MVQENLEFKLLKAFSILKAVNQSRSNNEGPDILEPIRTSSCTQFHDLQNLGAKFYSNFVALTTVVSSMSQEEHCVHCVSKCPLCFQVSTVCPLCPLCATLATCCTILLGNQKHLIHATACSLKYGLFGQNSAKIIF